MPFVCARHSFFWDFTPALHRRSSPQHGWKAMPLPALGTAVATQASKIIVMPPPRRRDTNCGDENPTSVWISHVAAPPQALRFQLRSTNSKRTLPPRPVVVLETIRSVTLCKAAFKPWTHSGSRCSSCVQAVDPQRDAVQPVVSRRWDQLCVISCVCSRASAGSMRHRESRRRCRCAPSARQPARSSR